MSSPLLARMALGAVSSQNSPDALVGTSFLSCFDTIRRHVGANGRFHYLLPFATTLAGHFLHCLPGPVNPAQFWYRSSTLVLIPAAHYRSG